MGGGLKKERTRSELHKERTNERNNKYHIYIETEITKQPTEGNNEGTLYINN